MSQTSNALDWIRIDRATCLLPSRTTGSEG